MTKHTNYISEETQFLQELTKAHPEISTNQRQQRATWWGINLDLDEKQALNDSELKAPPYAYFSYDEANIATSSKKSIPT